MMQTERQRRHGAALLFAAACVMWNAQAAFGCPEETVDYGTLHVRTFQGRILPHGGEELLPTEVEFMITAPDSGGREERPVPVEPDGEFVLPLAPGAYRFRIKAQGFLFTLVGTIIVGDSKDAQDRLAIRPPWC